MPIEPVKIPQNVYVEDRIIGPITLRQIMITMVSAGISYAIWAAMKASGPVDAVQTTMAWIPTVIGVLFAFVKINGISLFRILLLVIERIDKPGKRVWSPRTGIYINIVTKPAKDEPKQTQQAPKPEKDEHIKELSEVLDLGPEEEEPVIPKPVQPKRIQADKRKKPFDDISHPLTPPSHA